MNNMLSDQDTKALHDILVAQLDVQPDQVTPEARIQEDLGADSLDVMEIIMAVEERWQITIPDERAERVSTVADLVEALEELMEHTQRSRA